MEVKEGNVTVPDVKRKHFKILKQIIKLQYLPYCIFIIIYIYGH